jgi:hypothetical protein
MGEAKRRASTAARFLAEHPLCCFCGGHTVATTVDHVPPKILFQNKHRPKGLEFPDCETCNKSSSQDDSVLALVVRVAASATGMEFAKPDQSFHDIISTVCQAHPGLIARSLHRPKWRSVNGLRRNVAALNLEAPEYTDSLCRTAAKMALATYYSEVGRPAPVGSLVGTLWLHGQHSSNEQFGAITALLQLLPKLPQEASLIQGEWSTAGQFFARHLLDAGMLHTVAVAYRSLALMASVQLPESTEPFTDWQRGWIVTDKGLAPQPVDR